MLYDEDVSEAAPTAWDDYDPRALVGTGAHLSKDELWVWTRFVQASRLMEEVVAQQLSRDHGMTHSDYEVLVLLDSAGGRLRMSILANLAVSSSQKLTKTADRLERRGWIERVPVPGDGRGLEAVLLPAGRSALAEASAPHAALIRRYLLDVLAPAEAAVVADAMNEVAAHLRTHRDGQACPRCRTTGRRAGAPTQPASRRVQDQAVPKVSA